MSTYHETPEADLAINISSSAFTLLFKGDRLPLGADEQQVIIVETAEEASRFLALLGDSCKLYISPEYCSMHPEIEAKTQILANANHSYNPPFDTDLAVAMMRKLPLDLKSLTKSALALKEGGKMPPLINKELVHKSSDSNVLISEPFTTGWLHYFNMFQETTELTFDHPSEHIQGLLLSEALRQAGIACTHLQGLPIEGKLVLLNYSTNYFSFIERNEPVVLRAYSCFNANEGSQDKNATFFIQVLQWGRICADSKVTTFACMNTERQQQLNNRLEKIASRNKVHFESKVNRLLESELAN